MQQLVYQSFSRLGTDRLIWKMDRRRLRILCYHGVCEDRLIDQPWVPSFFVTQSRFKQHLQYLRERATVLSLREAVARLRDGSLPPRSVSITFDDGYANNVELAVPLLRRYSMPATVFLSTAYMISGDLFPFLRLKLIRLAGVDAASLPEYKKTSIDRVIAAADCFKGPEIGEDERRTLRPLTVEEVAECSASEPLIEFGAHTHTHCILTNETPERRQWEIQTSIRHVREWTGQPAAVFSYPNGQRGDFDDLDRSTLNSQNISAAVTGIAGANSRGAGPLDLRRYPMGLYHDHRNFSAEVTGFRSFVRSVTGRIGL